MTFTADDPDGYVKSTYLTISDGYTPPVYHYAGEGPTFRQTMTAPGGVGPFTLKLVAIDNGGNTVSVGPIPLVAKRSSQPPTATLTAPSANATYAAPANITMRALAADADGTVAKVEFLVDGNVVATQTQPPFAYTAINLMQGGHSLKVRVTDDSGTSTDSETVLVGVYSEPTIDSISPADGSTINDDRVTVSGRVHAPGNAAVTVNGVFAGLDEQGYFVANNVYLTPGANAIVISLNTLTSSITQTVNVTSTGSRDFLAELDQATGFAPLTVELGILNRRSRAFSRVEVDANGDGIPDLTLAPGDFELDEALRQFTYSEPGKYAMGVRVIGMNNEVLFSDTIQVVVNDVLSEMAKTGGAVTYMLQMLAGGNPGAALSHFTGEQREAMAELFAGLQSPADTAIPLSSIGNVVMDGDHCALTIVRDTPDGKQAFFVQLLRGRDGIWRIEAM